jgi:pyruvate/2-oxoglutarate dehydrogenase complex dihydrolipoamide acyltransferase (E2) component
LERPVGLIRKSLAVGTGGVVSGSSKKQKVAKKTLKASEQSAQASRQIAESTEAAAAHAAMLTQRLDQQAAIDHQFRYDTDPTYRQWVDGREAAAAALAAEQASVAATARANAADARAAAIAAKAPPVWQEGDRVVVTMLGFRGKQGEVVKQGKMGCTIKLDDGKTMRAVDPRKLEPAPDA